MEETATHPQGYKSLGCPNLWHNYAQSKLINTHEFSLINIRIFQQQLQLFTLIIDSSRLDLQTFKYIQLILTSMRRCGRVSESDDHERET